MEDGNAYGWIPVYEAIATKLLEYEERQDELTAIVKDVIGDSYDEMDPLTFFSMFNGKITNEERRFEAVKNVIEGLGIELESTVDFRGIPVTDARKWRFWGGEPGQVEDNWSVFRAALAYADSPSAGLRAELAKAFDRAKSHKNVKYASLSMALYWARPQFYLTLDGHTRHYLENRYHITVSSALTGQGYLELIDKVKAVSGVQFPYLSYAAWELKGWIPAPSEWAPGLSVDQWKELLKDSSVIDEAALITLKCLAEHPKGKTCTELADEYGRGRPFYSNAITTLGRRVAKRTGIKLREVDQGKYWPVTCVGNYVTERRKRLFKWRLRSEVFDAIAELDLANIPTYMPMDDLPWFDEGHFRKLISLYKEDFARFRGAEAPGGDRESYKWDRVANFKGYWDIDAQDFSSHVVSALKPAAQGDGQLLGSGHEYSFDRLTKLLDFDQEAVREAFRALLNPEASLPSSYESFASSIDELVARYNEVADTPIDKAYQNAKAVSLYLFFRYPERYHYYKPTVADSLSFAVGSTLPKDATARFVAYEALCEALMPVVMSDSELVSMSDAVLNERQLKADPEHHLLLQDIGYYCDVYMKEWHPDWKELLEGAEGANPTEEASPMTTLKYSKNLILYGPPGTGKTYQTKAYAVSICDGLSLDKVMDSMRTSEGYEQVSQRYSQLKDEGRIGFTTFHQSYGYEEFIEGIRPVVVSEDESDDTVDGIAYKLEDGVFKSFCRRAAAPVERDEAVSFGFNESPTVWKVSLGGSGNNPARSECIANDHIRIGWDGYGPEITDETDFTQHGGKKVLNAFYNKMRKGDIILSCYTSTTIDAIGVVTGDAEWHDEYDELKRQRGVRWLVKGLNYDVVSKFGIPTMTLSTVYRLKLDAPQVVSLLDEVGATKRRVTSRDTLPCVFIIDEINRGNISKVFGELITLLEENKRKGNPEEAIATLPYSGEDFGVPSNVYVLGTMNTADRSIALMDTALRRRFSFVEVMPDPSVLEGASVEGVDIP